MELIKLSSISVAYDTKEVLCDANLSICSGDFIGIIGPNGGGKTTLVKTILTLVKPSTGEVKYCKDDLKIG